MPTARQRKWYARKGWKRKAALQLKLQPLCCHCLKQGRVVPAQVADHVEAVGDDPTKFWTGELQSLCASCHSGWKQQQECLGFSTEFDALGYPIDPLHYGNSGKILKKSE